MKPSLKKTVEWAENNGGTLTIGLCGPNKGYLIAWDKYGIWAFDSRCAPMKTVKNTLTKSKQMYIIF